MFRVALRAILAALTLSVPAAAQQLYPAGWNPILAQDWGGLNVLLDSSDIGIDAQVARNVLTDGGYLEKRPGNTLLTTLLDGYGIQYVGDWVAPSGTRYLIAQASSTVYRTDFSASAVALGTVTTGKTLSSVASFSRIYFADGSKPFWYWDETSTGTVVDAGSGNTEAPHCTYLAAKDTRIFCGNIPNEGTSRVRISSAGGAGYFTVPSDVGSVDNAPNVFDFLPNDGDTIQCMASTPWGVFVGKKYSTHMIKGTGNLTYEPRLIDPKVGCVDNRSVQMVNGVLQWLSVDGVYGYDAGGPPGILSRKLDPILRGLNFADATSREWITDTQSQWQAGNLTASGAGAPISATLVVGAITPSSATFLDTSTTTFALGTCVGCGIDSRGQIAFAGVTSTYSVTYDANAVPTSDGWSGAGTFSVASGSLTITNAGSATKSANVASGQNKMVVVRAAANMTGTNNSLLVGMGGDGQIDVRCAVWISSTQIRYGREEAWESYTSNVYSTFTIVVSSDNNNISFWRDGTFKSSFTITLGVCTGTHLEMSNTSNGYGFVDFIYASTAVISPGTSDIVSVATFTSRIYNTTFSTPTLTLNITSVPVSGTTLSFTVRASTSANDDMWNGFLSHTNVGNGLWPSTNTKQYVEYRATFTHTNLIEAPSFSTASLTATTTGYYYSPVHFVGSNITSWGSINVIQTVPDGGTITYQVRQATYSFSDGTNIAWTAQTANQDVGLSVSTPTYFQFRALFEETRAAANPTISRVQVSWNEGAQTTVASGVNDRRYFLCVAVSTTATQPDTCFVRQKNNEWVTWEGPSIGAMGLYNNQLVVGDGSTGSKIWEVMQEGVYTDDGTAIDSEWVGADYTLNSVFNDKVLHEMWLDAEAVSLSSMTVGYTVNKASFSVDKTIYLDNGRAVNPSAYPKDFMLYGAINAHIPLQAGYATGKYHRLTFSNAINNAYFRLNSYLMYLEPKPRTTPPRPGNSLP